MTEQKSDDLRMGALYIRVSTHEQDELSPDAQKRLLLDYAKSNGIVIQNAKMIASINTRTGTFTIVLPRLSMMNLESTLFFKSLPHQEKN